MVATGVLFLLLCGQPAPDQMYREIVALQNRALQPDSGTAAQDHRSSIDIARRLGRPRLLAVLFQRLGRYLEGTDVQQAVMAYEAALSALANEPGFNVERELDRLTRLPKGYSGSNRAIPVDLYSQELATQLDRVEADPQIVVYLLLDIGNAYFQQPQLEVALDRYRSALARPEIADAPMLRAYALANIGEIDRRQGRIDEAEKALREALKLFETYRDGVEARRALVVLAGIQRDRGEQARALETYSEALTLYARTEDPRGEGRAYGAVGRLHLNVGRLAEARSAFVRAVELGERTKDRLSLWHAYWGLGQVQQQTGELEAAVVSLRRSLDLIESSQQSLSTDEGKVTFLDSTREVFDQLASLHLSRASTNSAAYGDALEIAERGRAGAMRDMMGVRTRSGLYCAPPSRPEPPRNSPVQMAPAVRSDNPIASGPPDVRCGRESSRTAAPVAPLTRLVFHVLPDRTAVFAVAADRKVHGYVAPFGAEAIAKRVRGFRDALGVDSTGRGVEGALGVSPSPNAYSELARSLYRDLIAPLAYALPPGETIAIEPHGALWLVPFAALEDENGVPMAERWPIVYAPSEQILNEIRTEPGFAIPTDLNALIIGNPLPPNVTPAGDDRFRSALRATFQSLPGAEAEAKALAALLQPEHTIMLTGSDADLATIESRMRGRTLVHIASHALAFADAPLDSFVMLASSKGNDGRLSVRRVLDLTIPADLVTLSACQTGMGYLSGDGVIGLSRAFLVRGARSVLVSQWSVSDTATAALMDGFYRRYLSSGGDKARSLQQVMRVVRSTSGFEHPRFWAPFVLIGAER